MISITRQARIETAARLEPDLPGHWCRGGVGSEQQCLGSNARLAAIAAGKEVIVSRGEAVEIGGGFRIPDVLRQSGATLVEVGTTNRTYASDFASAINERTGAILSVHASNFRVMGFTHAPTIAELVNVGETSGVPVLHDLGSGCLLDSSRYGLAHEPMPRRA